MINQDTSDNNSNLQILEIDPWLKSYENDLVLRMNHYQYVKKSLLGEGKSFKDFANGHHFFGFHQADEPSVFPFRQPRRSYCMGVSGSTRQAARPLCLKKYVRFEASNVYQPWLTQVLKLAHAEQERFL